MATTPPGWYDDGRGALRWWDGAQWTEHVQTPDPEPAAVSPDEAMDDLLNPSTDATATAEPAVPAETAVAAEPAIPAAPTLESARTDAQPAAPAQPEAFPTEAFPTEAFPTAGVYPPSAPPGYPGGFPGGPAPSGAFISATEPKKSKLWILWVVLGVVLLGIAILAAVLIPIVIGLFGSIANSGGSGSGSSDEAAAVAAVELYDEAWNTADCAKFEEATTEDFRAALQLEDCEIFTSSAQSFNDQVDDYEISVVSVDSGSDGFIVETLETYTAMLDEDNNPTDEAVPYEESWTYTVVETEGRFAIASAD